ncbi:MAG: 5'-nucleotidase [Gammaproteobacteria bacterium]
MPESLEGKLVVAISSRALFDLECSHAVFVEHGVDAYADYQRAHEGEPLAPGVAYGTVRKLLRLNEGGGQAARAVAHSERPRVEVILLSRNSADTGLRVFNSIEHYGLDIERAAFTGGESPYQYVKAFGAHLFLSTDTRDVRAALDAGCAAAALLAHTGAAEGDANGAADDPLKIAFDGDAVLFSDASERVFKEQGLEAFKRNEKDAAAQPLSSGPFRPFLAALHAIQTDSAAGRAMLRTALVTARSAPAHERVVRTLRDWGIRIDEALFLGGLDKTEFLHAFGADIFFDDQLGHVERAARRVPSGHVPHGVANERAASRCNGAEGNDRS